MKNNRSVSAAAGEYLVLGELLKRGFEAYLAHGETQKGWDLLIVNQPDVKRVQVKTINWPDQLAINGNLTEGFDFLVVVLLNRGSHRSRFFVFDVRELDLLISAPNMKRGQRRTLTMSKKSISEKFKEHEDKWDVFHEDEKLPRTFQS